MGVHGNACGSEGVHPCAMCDGQECAFVCMQCESMSACVSMYVCI